MAEVSPNKDTYFVCIHCGTTYRYLIEPAVDLPKSILTEDRDEYAPTCTHCGAAMIVTNSEDCVVFIRDALRKIWEGEAA